MLEIVRPQYTCTSTAIAKNIENAATVYAFSWRPISISAQLGQGAPTKPEVLIIVDILLVGSSIFTTSFLMLQFWILVS